jgi:penicillin V acylase-like amidase (Ntn superfamily)
MEYRFCTSIVAQQKDGQIIHGRNLDYEFSPELQNLTYIAEYYRDGELLFTSGQLAGYIGVLTGHKYKRFTFSINERGTCLFY